MSSGWWWLPSRVLPCVVLVGTVVACSLQERVEPTDARKEPEPAVDSASKPNAEPASEVGDTTRCAPCTVRTLAAASFAYEVVMDEVAVYWVSDPSGLVASPRAGGEQRVLMRDASQDGLAISRDAAFVCRVGSVDGDRRIVRVAKKGGEPVDVAAASDCELAVVGEHLYFPVRDPDVNDMDRLARVGVGGGDVERIGGATPPISQIVGDETHVYWQDELAIRRASRADGTVEMFFDKPDGWGPLVLTATHVVWAQGKDPAGSPVLRKKKQGGGSPETIAAMQRASDLASDGTRVYWTDSRRWVRWDPATPETRTSFAVPQFVSSIAVDGTTVAFNRFTDKGGIDVLDTCGCGSDVLVPDAAPP